jgi:hypothetical protein
MNMSRIKKLLAVGVAVLVLSALSVTALAVAAYESPAEAVAGLTGRPVDDVIEEKTETGNTYGQIANDAGVLDEFKASLLEMKKDILDAKVAEGKLTQADADEIMAAIEANMATCDGTGGAKVGQSYGAGFGSGSCGLGNGNGYKGQFGQGGNGQGNCTGLMLCDGSCGR